MKIHLSDFCGSNAVAVTGIGALPTLIGQAVLAFSAQSLYTLHMGILAMFSV